MKKADAAILCFLLLIAISFSGCILDPITTALIEADVQSKSNYYCDEKANASGNWNNPSSVKICFNPGNSQDKTTYDTLNNRLGELPPIEGLQTFAAQLRQIDSTKTARVNLECYGHRTVFSTPLPIFGANCQIAFLGWNCSIWEAPPKIVSESCPNKKCSAAGSHFSIFADLASRDSFGMQEIFDVMNGASGAKCVGYCGNGIKETAAQLDSGGVNESCDCGSAGKPCTPAQLGGATCESILGQNPAGTGYTGSPTCNPTNCNILTTECIANPPAGPVCGNGTIETGEECDGGNLPIKTCAQYNSKYTSGNLSCIPAGQSNQCKYNTNDCKPNYCGDALIDQSIGEQCDCGDPWSCSLSRLGNATCNTPGIMPPSTNGYSGNLACYEKLSSQGQCKYNKSDCRENAQTECTTASDCSPQTCKTAACASNHCNYTPIAAGSEQAGICDATNGCTTKPCQCDGIGTCISVVQHTECTNSGGNCKSSCSETENYNSAGDPQCISGQKCCVPRPIECGNGIKEATEQCDCGASGGTCSAAQLGGITTCAEYSSSTPGAPVYTGGNLACIPPGDNGCKYDFIHCVPNYCEKPGDPPGTLQPGEECDGTNLNGKTCATAFPGKIPLPNHTGDTLACIPRDQEGQCHFDPDSCMTPYIAEYAQKCFETNAS